jgi:hypothetical protein
LLNAIFHYQNIAITACLQPAANIFEESMPTKGVAGCHGALARWRACFSWHGNAGQGKPPTQIMHGGHLPPVAGERRALQADVPNPIPTQYFLL